jgi:cytochrome b
MQTVTEIKVWDPLVRLFHWLLVAAFFTAYFSEDDWQDVHVIAGYTVFGLIAFRLLWGLAGTGYARFSNFVYPPGTVLAYLRDLPVRKAARFIGHNPAGGAMIIMLLLSLLVTTASGIAYYGADQWQGPLAGLMKNADEFWVEALKETHEISANFTLTLVVIHVLGVVGESWLHKENLVYAMVHGRKRA